MYDSMKKRNYKCANEHTLTEIRWGRDSLPICPECSQEMQEFYPYSETLMIATDDIPGGIEIRHGVCNPDGSPRKFYSKSEIRKAANEAGLTISGETPKPNQRVTDQKYKEAESRGRSWI